MQSSLAKQSDIGFRHGVRLRPNLDSIKFTALTEPCETGKFMVTTGTG